MRKVIFMICGVLFLLSACRKKESPKPPGQAQLIFPERNSECTTGQSLGNNISQVSFNWQEAQNVKTYELRVTNLNAGTIQTITTTETSASLPIEKGTPFSWLVRTRNNQVEETVSSETWSFYNAGSNTYFAPFPAAIISPRMSERVFKDINNEVTLSWSGSDLDDDIINFEVYFSTENPPLDSISTLGNAINEQKVTVASNTVYYWSILTKDSQGNETNSGVYSFQVL